MADDYVLRKTIKEGNMYKRGVVNTDWKLRKFVLNGKQLHYFKGAKSTPSGTIDLKKIVSVSDMEEDCTFHIVYPGRTYKLRGLTTEAGAEWRDAIAVAQQAAAKRP
ncbi:pleckstrin-like [Oscarella lobularis]|uniref:pleckstrin-like n=1 Tax=Oscarella lobularis TaxID=121494 RepID=UPI0033134605